MDRARIYITKHHIFGSGTYRVQLMGRLVVCGEGRLPFKCFQSVLSLNCKWKHFVLQTLSLFGLIPMKIDTNLARKWIIAHHRYCFESFAAQTAPKGSSQTIVFCIKLNHEETEPKGISANNKVWLPSSPFITIKLSQTRTILPWKVSADVS